MWKYVRFLFLSFVTWRFLTNASFSVSTYFCFLCFADCDHLPIALFAGLISGRGKRERERDFEEISTKEDRIVVFFKIFFRVSLTRTDSSLLFSLSLFFFFFFFLFDSIFLPLSPLDVFISNVVVRRYKIHIVITKRWYTRFCFVVRTDQRWSTRFCFVVQIDQRWSTNVATVLHSTHSNYIVWEIQ